MIISDVGSKNIHTPQITCVKILPTSDYVRVFPFHGLQFKILSDNESSWQRGFLNWMILGNKTFLWFPRKLIIDDTSYGIYKCAGTSCAFRKPISYNYKNKKKEEKKLRPFFFIWVTFFLSLSSKFDLYPVECTSKMRGKMEHPEKNHLTFQKEKRSVLRNWTLANIVVRSFQIKSLHT